VIDSWFRAQRGTDSSALTESGRGIPFVHVSIDMCAPLTPRDTLATTVLLERGGQSTPHFYLIGRRNPGVLLFEGRFVSAFRPRRRATVDLDPRRVP
jgi:acyl-CoA thioesterase FadM